MLSGMLSFIFLLLFMYCCARVHAMVQPTLEKYLPARPTWHDPIQFMVFFVFLISSLALGVAVLNNQVACGTIGDLLLTWGVLTGVFLGSIFGTMVAGLAGYYVFIELPPALYQKLPSSTQKKVESTLQAPSKFAAKNLLVVPETKKPNRYQWAILAAACLLFGLFGSFKNPKCGEDLKVVTPEQEIRKALERYDRRLLPKFQVLIECNKAEPDGSATTLMDTP